jgi:hypothetical protein
VVVYETALLACVQCRPCPSVDPASVKGSLEDVLSKDEEDHKKLRSLVRTLGNGCEANNKGYVQWRRRDQNV